MKVKHLISFAIVFSLVFPDPSFATSWAYPFVVWDGYIYVVSDEYVTEIDSEIGQVTKYSEMEQYSGNFSNVYEKGTKYYSIENTSTEDTGDTQINDQESTSEHTNSNDEKSSTSNKGNSEAAELSKGEYLEKLNKMEEADRYAEVVETMPEMVAQEKERYKKWDEELNKIYGVLEEQLPPDQMDKLREKQRDWVEHRDKAAKEASLKYEGGSTEELEYVATQASLTRERCYELVARYMK
ncbi:lysozyme inhibitor LprI family protein [Halobacillus hunanensis]|uniref:lysozyme inhibitor LprI family protein n=1 Tax=Halobacillus hunanensis TaxID=578214 RepID=UPI001FEA94EB|nr:lysozyme inhibitor LprI family protein [Halobacillus hunanensis]